MKQIVFVPAGLVVAVRHVCWRVAAQQNDGQNPPLEEPPPAEVEHEQDGALVKVDHPGAVPAGHRRPACHRLPS